MQEVNAPGEEEIRHELARVLACPMFHASKRFQRFLEYVCERALAGDTAALKERVIAIEVFGRDPQIGLGDDTIVRVNARDVRKRLAQFYVTPEGMCSNVRIDLPPGAYAPEFRRVSQLPHPDAALPSPSPAPIPAIEITEIEKTTGRGIAVPRAAWIGAILLVLAATGFSLFRQSRASPETRAFQLFWNPVFAAREPLLIALAHPLVYHPSRRAQALNDAAFSTEESLSQHPLKLPPNVLTGSDFVPVFNQYVGFGDMVAANEVSTMLARHSRNVRIRLASSVEFADLRGTQTLLIGGVTNRWTTQFQQGWRFRLKRNAEQRVVIADTRKLAANGLPDRQWIFPATQDGSASEDYILICRVHNSLTGGLTIVAAGLRQFGTEAAGRVLADPQQLGVILSRLPAGWESRNLQLVLHARVIGNAPAQPELEDSQVW